MVSCTKPPSVNVLHRKLFRVLTPTANLITAILHRTPESFIWYVLVFFVIFFFYLFVSHSLHQFFCYQFSKEPVTETNETNDGNQWRTYIISMLPMITTGFGYGYSLRHSSVVSAFTAHTLTNSFVNHPPPHPSGCGYNMKSHSELHWKIKVTNIQYSFPNLVSWDPPTIASEQT